MHVGDIVMGGSDLAIEGSRKLVQHLQALGASRIVERYWLIASFTAAHRDSPP